MNRFLFVVVAVACLVSETCGVMDGFGFGRVKKYGETSVSPGSNCCTSPNSFCSVCCTLSGSSYGQYACCIDTGYQEASCFCRGIGDVCRR